VSDDFDLDADLTIGEQPKPKRGRGRPKSAKTLRKEAAIALEEEARLSEEEALAAGGEGLPSMSSYGNVEHAMKPLTAAQLAQVWRTDRKTVMAKLRGCPPVAKNTRGAFLYDLATASAYLVEPKVAIEAHLKRLRPADLPPYLHDAYWAALEKRQKVELRAGDLWETEKVIDVFGELAKKIKSQVMLWTDQLEKRKKLTPEEREFFNAQCDGLLSSVFEAFTSLQEENRTGSLLEKYREEATGERQAVEMKEERE